MGKPHALPRKSVDRGVSILEPAFFDRPALKVARDLIGCGLHSALAHQPQAFVITETEAYVGQQDLASHASKGRTARTEPMFGPPGTLYVYLCYGIHWMLNVVTGPVDHPAAVLIRGVDGIDGPGRLTKRLGITGDLTGKEASTRTGIWFSKGRPVRPRSIERSARIGVDYAGPVWSAKPYRFVFRKD